MDNLCKKENDLLDNDFSKYDKVYHRIKRIYPFSGMELNSSEEKILLKIIGILKSENLEVYQGVAILDWSKFIIQNCTCLKK